MQMSNILNPEQMLICLISDRIKGIAQDWGAKVKFSAVFFIKSGSHFANN